MNHLMRINELANELEEREPPTEGGAIAIHPRVEL